MIEKTNKNPQKAPNRPLSLVALTSSYTAVRGGTPAVMRNLFQNMEEHEVILLSRKRSTHSKRYMAVDRAFRVIEIPPREGGRFEVAIRITRVITGLFQGLIAIRRFRPRTIVAVYMDDVFLLLGYCLARLTGIPLVVYFLDLYQPEVDRQESSAWLWQKFLARWLEPRVFRRASKVMALTEALAEHYHILYGREVVELPGCVNFAGREQRPIRKTCDPLVIGYSGSINSARLDLLQKIIQVIDGNDSFQFRFFSPVSEEDLNRRKLSAENVELFAFECEETLIDEMSNCDLLYIPITFSKEQVSRLHLATCFGAKTYGYLSTGRPILLQCPDDFYMARFFRREECGYVLSSDRESDLLATLKILKSDFELRQRLGACAANTAISFEGRRVTETFRNILEDVSCCRGDARHQ